MSTIRVVRRDRWTTVATEAIEDDSLSFRARGVLVWLLAKPDGWTVNSVSIANHGTEGRDAVRTALAELETAGYLQREKLRQEDGTIITVSTVYEERQPAPRNPASVEPAPDNPAPERDNQDLVITDPPPPTRLNKETLPTSQECRLDGTLYPAEFLDAWNAYPFRHGSKNAAYTQWRRRVIEADKSRPRIARSRRMEALVTATKAYAAERLPTGDEEHTKRAETFYGPGNHWRDYVMKARGTGLAPTVSVPSVATGIDNDFYARRAAEHGEG